MTSFNEFGFGFTCICGLLSLKRPFCSWNVERRDWCVVDVADVLLFGEPDAAGCCINWFPIDCRRFLNMLFSSCNFFIWFVSISMRVSVGCGIHWNIVAKKLCSDTSSVSCHCFVKQTANTACSSGFLQNGKTEKETIFIHIKSLSFPWKMANTYKTNLSIRTVNVVRALALKRNPWFYPASQPNRLWSNTVSANPLPIF